MVCLVMMPALLLSLETPHSITPSGQREGHPARPAVNFLAGPKGGGQPKMASTNFKFVASCRGILGQKTGKNGIGSVMAQQGRGDGPQIAPVLRGAIVNCEGIF